MQAAEPQLFLNINFKNIPKLQLIFLHKKEFKAVLMSIIKNFAALLQHLPSPISLLRGQFELWDTVMHNFHNERGKTIYNKNNNQRNDH